MPPSAPWRGWGGLPLAAVAVAVAVVLVALSEVASNTAAAVACLLAGLFLPGCAAARRGERDGAIPAGETSPRQ